MKRPSSSFVQVGAITAAHGIKGQVKIRSFANPPKAIFSYGILQNESGSKSFSVTAKGGADDALIASIDGVNDRNAAELLRGTALYAQAEKVPVDAREKLVGMIATLPDGKTFGTILAVHNYGAGDVVEIRMEKGGVEMLPMDERFITVKKDQVIVTPPEYLEAKE